MDKKKEITKQIKQKVKELNVLIRKAYKMGLQIQGVNIEGEIEVYEKIT